MGPWLNKSLVEKIFCLESSFPSSLLRWNFISANQVLWDRMSISMIPLWSVTTFRQGHTPDVGAMTFTQPVEKYVLIPILLEKVWKTAIVIGYDFLTMSYTRNWHHDFRSHCWYYIWVCFTISSSPNKQESQLTWQVMTFRQGHKQDIGAMTFVQTVDNILTSLFLDSQPLQMS